MNKEKLIELATTYGLRAVAALLLLAASWLIAGWIQRLVERACQKAKIDMTLGMFFSKIARWIVIVFAVITCLSVFGVQTTSFAAVIGAAGLAVGFALQGSLSNFSAGAMLLVFRPIKVGDLVRINDHTGTVHEIGMFTTVIDTPDKRRITFPNGNVIGSTLINMTFHPMRRVEVDVGISYGADIDKTREALLKAGMATPGRVDDPPPSAYLMGFGASSVDWQVRVWCKSTEYLAVKEAAVRATKYALDEAGISIPFPQVDVHFDNQNPFSHPQG
ncbi:MAG TPA: mechanosensitive ion channel family protein [Candidatus Brocadiia bacterium]|nr:mechanosensitive ion channel family protein [Candidatus Brocadiia bacterium]